MKRILLLAVLLAAMWVGTATAFETPVTSEKGKAILAKMGKDLTPVATGLGCNEFAWANFVGNGNVAALEYVPAGDNVKKWTRLVSMAIYALSGKPAEDKAMMEGLVKNLVSGYKKNGKVIKAESFTNKKGEPGLFIEYTIGEGTAKEHNAGVFLRISDRTAAFIQTQSRGKALSAEQSAKVRKLIGSK